MKTSSIAAVKFDVRSRPNRNGLYLRLVISVLLISVTGTRACRSAEGPQFTIEDIDSAWRERQKRTQSVKLEWRLQQTEFKGRTIPEGQTHGGRKGPIPESDIDLTFELILIVSGGRIRFQEKGKQFSVRSGQFSPWENTMVWNGTEGRRLYDYAEHQFDTGGVNSSTRYLGSIAMRAPMYAFWPLGQSLGEISLSDYKLQSETVEIDGTPCLVLDRKTARPIETEIYVAPEREFSILRVVGRHGKSVHRQLDLTYTHDSKFGWHLEKWHFVIMQIGGAGFAHISDSELTNIDFAYEASESDFVLNFPAGTRISDFRHGDDEVEYIVQSDQTWRPVIPGEKRLSTKKLLDTQPGQFAISAGEPSDRRWLLWVNLAILVLLSVAIVTIRLKKRRRGGGQ